jgi:hypothetical protein
MRKSSLPFSEDKIVIVCKRITACVGSKVK